jgi:hypothetical protein
LIGADNSRWMAAHVRSSEFPFDNLRLMMSSFGERYILMGSPGKQTGASPRVDAEGNWQNAIRDLGSVTNTGARFRGVMRPVPPPQGLVGASAHANVLQGPNRPAAPAPTPRGPPRNVLPVANVRSFWRTSSRAQRTPASGHTPAEGTYVWNHSEESCPDTIVKLYSGPIKVLTNTSSTFNGGLAIVEGRDKNQVAGLELTETFLLCGRAAQKTHLRNIVVFFHPMSQIQVASGKFDAATTVASITRLESELSFLQVKATMTMQERIRQVKGDIWHLRE